MQFGKCWTNLSFLTLNTEGIAVKRFQKVLATMKLKSLCVNSFYDSLKRKGNLEIFGQTLREQKALTNFKIDLELTMHRDGLNGNELSLLVKQMNGLRKFVYKVSIESYFELSFALEKMQYEVWTPLDRPYKQNNDLYLEYLHTIESLATELIDCKPYWELHWSY